MTTPPPDPAGLFDLTGRVAVVTGASSGLGRRFAQVLDAAGAHVVAVARRADRLDELVAGGRSVSAFAGDVTDTAAMAELVERTVGAHGRIDVLVNNAGVGTARPALDEDLDDFRHVLEVNLVSLFGLCRLVGRQMIAAGEGSIVNVASILGLGSGWPIPNAGYTASKAAVVNLTRDLACQWAGKGVRVNAIAPGFFPSEMTEVMDDEKSAAYITRNTPMRRMGRAEELDGVLLFLASRASSFVTGQTVAVDGGWTAH